MTGWAEGRREAALWRDFERSEAEQVACPECHQPAGERCQNLDGGGPLEKFPAHWRRIKASEAVVGVGENREEIN